MSLCFVVLDKTCAESDRDPKGNDRYLDTHEIEPRSTLVGGSSHRESVKESTDQGVMQ